MISIRLLTERINHMQDIDLIISGGKALLMDEQNTCLENAAIAVNASSIH